MSLPPVIPTPTPPAMQPMPASFGPMVTGSQSRVCVAWDGEGSHPSMRISASSSQQLKELSMERGAIIFAEYLTYDKDTPAQMQAFVQLYPWVLTEPLVCTAVVGNPNCYHGLKQMGWWDDALANVAEAEDIADLWLKNMHVRALAHDASADQIARIVDWPSWEILVQEHGPVHEERNGDLFSRTQALVVLANRLGVDLAPLMCAAMHVLMPLDTLETVVAGKWSPLQKAQYAWLLDKTGFVGDIWPAAIPVKQALRQAHKELGDWIRLVDASELANLSIVYDLNNSNLDETIFELIQLAQNTHSTESLDYTHALGHDESPAA